jgi:putative SOS response-associated peptidase YedK
MCGRYTLFSRLEVWEEIHQAQGVPELKPRYNIAPTQQVIVIRLNEEGQREKVMMHWGLIPSWAKDPSIGNRMINARAETVAEKPSFRAAFKRRRCLIPANGFYEWKKVGKRKQPYYVRRIDGEPMAFAGLWEHWEGQDGTVVESCTIITTESNSTIRPLHNRMPVILDPEEYNLWLDSEVSDLETLAPLMRPYPDDKLEAILVSTLVNNPRNDDARCIEPPEKS